MKKAYYLDAQRRKNEEGYIAYSSQSGFSALYLQRSHKNICTVQALQSADQWNAYQTLPPKYKEDFQRQLLTIPINYFVLERLLKSAPNRPDGSLGFFSEYGHSMSIRRDSDGWLTIFSSEYNPNYDSESDGSYCVECTLDDPIDLFEKAREASDDSFMRLSDEQWDQMLRSLILKLFDLPDYKTLPTFALTLPQDAKQIPDRAFFCASSVSSAVIPRGVTRIGSMAFAGCTNLSEITLPAALKTLGSCAFAYCRSLKSIVIPEGVEIIPDNTFKRCTSLRTVTLPRSLKRISNSAFEGCTALEQIALPAGLRSIGSDAFASCGRLRSIVIPPRISAIENGTFFACHMLESIRLPEGIRSIGSRSFFGSSLRSIVIPEGVRTIADLTFQNCTRLESVTLPDSVEAIGERAFCATTLETIRLPHGITSIGKDAFAHCPALTQIILPDSVSRIAAGLFKSCRALYSVTLPAALPAVPDDTFEDCGELVYIIAPIDKIPECNREGACIGFARNEQLYPHALHSGYHAFIRTHINDLLDAAFKEAMLLRLICREKLIDQTHFPALLDESIRRNEIELTSLLLDYKQTHSDILPDNSDDSLSLE